MYKREGFNYGEIVIYDNRPMRVSGLSSVDKSLIGLSERNAKYIYTGIGSFYPQYSYFPIKDVKKIKKVEIDEETRREYFRLEITPWDLAEKNVAIKEGSKKKLFITEEDVEALMNNLEKTDYKVYEDWENYFINSNMLITDKPSFKRIDFPLTWMLFYTELQHFDLECDTYGYLINLWKTYKKNINKEFDEILLFNDYYAYKFKRIIENNYKKCDERIINIYKKCLKKLYTSNKESSVKTAAYTYYGGNKIIEADWKMAEKCLLKMYRMNGDVYTANSLGYIYYSNRLGKPDYDKAFYYFNIAAEKKIVEATYKLSDLYRKGHGVKKNTKKAFKILSELFLKEYPLYQEGCYGRKLADIALRMGYFYEEGLSVNKDLNIALNYFLLAREAINKRRYYEEYGDEVVRKNISEAIKRVRKEMRSIDL